MAQNFEAGDFLIFQLEAAYGLLRVLDREGEGEDTVWHLAAYEDMFADIESAETAASEPNRLRKSIDHAALTNRAFESTQVAKLIHLPLVADEIAPLDEWRNSADKEISDRSIRLLLGLR